jgi:hypothetical protein
MEDDTGTAYGAYKEKNNACMVFVGEPTGKRPL